MTLRSWWNITIAKNQYDTFSQDELDVLEKVFFTGAAALYTELSDPKANKSEIILELKRYLDALKKAQSLQDN